MKQQMDLEKINKIYMIGIKGSGMIAFVEIFHAMGKEVYGSDVAEEFFTDATLKRLELKYEKGFSKKNIAKYKNIDLVVHSTAYNQVNNVEVEYAKKNYLPILTYPEMIQLFSQSKKTIAVCGTHGKTTTSAMITVALKECGADPTAIIGSKVKQLDSSVAIGSSEFLVLEADEYQNKLASYSPWGVVLLNVEFDHPDYFTSIKEYKEVFISFIEKIPKNGFLIVCGDDLNAVNIAKNAKCKVVAYGVFEKKDQIQKIAEEFVDGGIKEFDFFSVPKELKLKVPGKHNLMNATAALAVCAQLDLSGKTAKEAIINYAGVSRRFEKIGKRNGALVIDDYAHHPTEIKATLAAAKERYPEKNLICIFHPHTFTRTKALFTEFTKSFKDADEVIVLDIYGSAREKQGGVTSKELVNETKKYHPNIKYIATIEKVYKELCDRINKKDLILTIGAGDIDKLANKLVGNI